MNTRHFFTTFALATVVGTAHAATSASYTAGELKSANTVLADLYRTNLMEIEVGKLAQEKADAKAVREYGEMLANDHHKSQEKVTALAGLMNIKFVAEDHALAGKENETLEKLNRLEGPAFDRAFATAMVTAHASAITRLEVAQKEASGETASLIAQTLPVLRQHKLAAEELLVVLKSGLKPS